MESTESRWNLMFSLVRGLWGEVHPALRQASIEADETAQIVRIRFEYDGEPPEAARESGSCVATEVLADFPPPWDLDEQHVAVPFPQRLSHLRHLVYRRWEPDVISKERAAVMKTIMPITVYGKPGNNATIHMPGRRNPGIAMQSDTLQGLIADLSAAVALIDSGDATEARDELEGVVQRLADIQAGMMADVRRAGDPDGSDWPQG